MKFLFKYKWSPNLLCTQMHALKYKCENMICILSGSIKENNGILLYASIWFIIIHTCASQYNAVYVTMHFYIPTRNNQFIKKHDVC